MRLRYTRTALRQIETILTYVADRSPQGAERLQARILASVGLVLEHPYAGQATSRPSTRRMVLTPYPYVLFYRVMADEVVVMRLRHAARKPLSNPSDGP